MVDHPFERRPARIHAVRPFARPAEDAAASPTRGPWAGRPTPFVSPSVPEPNAAAPASEELLAVEPAPADGGSPTDVEATDLTPSDHPLSPPDLPLVEASTGDRTPYPSWATLMEERAGAFPESPAGTHPATGDLPHQQQMPADVAAPDDRVGRQIADEFWADSSEHAASEHAEASSNLGGHDVHGTDRDDHDVEPTGPDVPGVETARTDGGDASIGAGDPPASFGDAAASPDIQPRAQSDHALAERQSGNAEPAGIQSEIDAAMMLEDIDLSGVSSYGVERVSGGAEPARDEALMRDLEAARDYGELAAIDVDVIAPDEAILGAADITAPRGDVAPPIETGPPELSAMAAPAAPAGVGGGEMAAAVLERLAGRLRRGELPLPDAGPHADDALTLAHVLTALLDTSRPASHGEPPPPTTGTEL